MPSTFVGIETAFRGLQAQQKALEVTGHNIANANTDGYSRQTAIISTTEPYTFPAIYRPISAGQMGTGAEVSSILRMRDSFMDSQVRQENQSLGRWQMREQSLEQLELIFNEPSTTGLSNALTQFWKDLQELAKKPENMAARSVVREQGVALAESFNHIYNQVTQLQHDLNQQLEIKVNEINSLASQIADLNNQIGKITAIGDQPNDLLDQRELLVQKLATLTNIEISTDQVNQYYITISGRSLVAGNEVTGIYLEPNIDRNGLYDVKWEDNHQNVQFRNGSVLGTLEIRDDEITFYQDTLNELAATIIQQMNAVHEAGYGLDGATGIAFFTGNSAENMAVSADILLDLRNIAASTSSEPGDGENASAMASLMQEQILNNNTATFSDFYSSMIARLGVDGQKAKTMAENQEILVNHLKDKQESVAGVSLNEEMANMVKFQNAYNAAARMMTTMNNLLDTIINKMGV
jgi:flagellar hook-associated protein 1 FlgK